METVGFLGLAAALICTGVVIVSLFSGRVPARWPVPSLYRRSTPKSFWMMIVIYAAGAIMSGLLASQFIN